MLEQIERDQAAKVAAYKRGGLVSLSSRALSNIPKTIGVKVTATLWNRLRKIQAWRGKKTAENTLKGLALEAMELGIGALERKYLGRVDGPYEVREGGRREPPPQ
jgi:hypothetical protein